MCLACALCPSPQPRTGLAARALCLPLSPYISPISPAQALLRAPGTSRRGATGGKASREVMP